MMKQLRRRISLASAVAIGASAFGVIAASEPAWADPPPTAIAMGDSFISGEGAGDYQPVVDENGTPRTFPGWTADNQNAFFCHRSANASIEVASLPDIEQRVNLACSGGQPSDMTNPSSDRPAGRWVDAQIQQMIELSEDHDIDVVLIGLGSNNSRFTFGQLGANCTARFVIDAYAPDWYKPASQHHCLYSDFPNANAMNAATTEATNAIRAIVQTLDQIDADGEHKIILQDYTNPLPPDYANRYHRERDRSDTANTFRPLANLRYQAGCPVHRASLGPAADFTRRLGNVVAQTTGNIAREFPDLDITYLNVQRAFDGARLCENPGSPGNALATPVRVQRRPNGAFALNLNSWRRRDLSRALNTCLRYYQTCQESLHPNAAGHAVLGQCLSAAVGSPAPTVECRRNPSNGTIIANDRYPTVSFEIDGTTTPTRDRVFANVEYKVKPRNALGEQLTNITVNAVAVTADLLDPQEYVFPTSHTAEGRFRRTFDCLEPATYFIRVSGSADLAGQTFEFSEFYPVDMSRCDDGGGPIDEDDSLDAGIVLDPG